MTMSRSLSLKRRLIELAVKRELFPLVQKRTPHSTLVYLE